MQNQPFIDKNKDKGSDNLWEVENGSHSINEESKLVNKLGQQSSQTPAGQNLDSDIDTVQTKAKKPPKIKLTYEQKVLYLAELGMKPDMTIIECFWKVVKLAVPSVIGMLLYLLVQLSNTFFIGNLN